MALLELLEKSGDEDFLREMVQWLAHRLMEADVEQRCGAGPYERSEQRQDYRNGTRSRQWDTRAGTTAYLTRALEAMWSQRGSWHGKNRSE